MVLRGKLIMTITELLTPIIFATGNNTVDEGLWGIDILTPFVLGILFFSIGIFFIIIEVMTPGFFVGIPGTIMVILGLAMVLFPEFMSTPAGPIIFIILVFLVTAGVFWIYNNLARPEPSKTTTTMTSLVGKEGIVLKKVVPHDISGKVQIGSQEWSSTSDIEINPGTKVEVVRVEGVHLIVKPLEKRRE